MGDEIDIASWGAMGGAQKRRPRQKTGGSELDRGVSELRVRVAYQAFQSFQTDYANPAKPMHYLRYATSLLKCLKECADGELRDEAVATLKNVLPLLDLNPFISFYLLLQPYRSLDSGVLIGEELIKAWAKGRITANLGGLDDAGVLAAYLQFFDNDLVQVYQEAGIDQGAVEEAIDRRRVEIDKQPPRDARGLILADYVILQQTGLVGRVRALPEATLKCLAPGQLAWQDTFRITVSARFDTARRHKGVEEFRKLIEYIYCSLPGCDYVREHTFLSDSAMEYNIGSRFDLLCLYKFMNSSDFLYRANASTEAGAPNGTLDPSSGEIYNRNGYVIRWMGKLPAIPTPSRAKALQANRVRLFEEELVDA